MKHNLLFSAIMAATLTACGGSSSSSSTSSNKAEPVQQVTAENISQAIQISGSTPATVDATTIPATLQPVTTSQTDSVVVTANSNFKTVLSVPSSDVPADKRVAGFLIESSPGNYVFVPASANQAQVASLTKSLVSGGQAEVINKKAKKYGFDQVKSRNTDKSVSTFADVANEGETEINFAGWSTSDFTLDTSIEDLVIRIYPLLVNKTVAQVLSINDIDLDDETNWVGVQELLLAVEAVATAEIQVSLTWDSVTDIDLWIIDEDGDKIYFANRVSNKSLGWLDFDNVYQYGPENITFNYQMPLGDYKVYVHHYDGGIETNYQVTIAVGDTVETVSGGFPEGVTDSDDIEGEGVDFIKTITIDGNLNSKLESPVALNQYQGVWALPQNSSAKGYVEVSADSLAFYSVSGDYCDLEIGYQGENFPTGFKISGGELKVSDALFGSDNEDEEIPSFSYKLLTLEQATLPENCSSNQYIDDEPF